MTEPLQRLFLGRARQLEREIRSLIDEMFDAIAHPPERRHYANSKIDVLFAEVDDLLHMAPPKPGESKSERDSKIRNIHELADQAIQAKAELDRYRRGLYREADDLEIEEKRKHAEHVRAEIEADGGQ